MKRESKLQTRRVRERCQHAMMLTEQQQMLLQQMREARNRSELTPESHAKQQQKTTAHYLTLP